MALLGLFSAAVSAMVADLAGNEKTRPFTRFAFLWVTLIHSGLSVRGLANWLFQVSATLI